jgi:hypothetical protein
MEHNLRYAAEDKQNILLHYLNEPGSEPYGSLSFEFPLLTADLDSTATKLAIQAILAKKNPKFPGISTSECWQNNFHMTITGFPQIPAKYFSDPTLRASLDQLIREYIDIVTSDYRFSERTPFELDQKEPIKILGDAMFLIPTNNISLSVKEMMRNSLQIFTQFKPAFWVQKENKLGVHVTLDIVAPKDPSLRADLQRSIVEIFKNQALQIGSIRATVIFHSGYW